MIIYEVLSKYLKWAWENIDKNNDKGIILDKEEQITDINHVPQLPLFLINKTYDLLRWIELIKLCTLSLSAPSYNPKQLKISVSKSQLVDLWYYSPFDLCLLPWFSDTNDMEAFQNHHFINAADYSCILLLQEKEEKDQNATDLCVYAP